MKDEQILKLIKAEHGLSVKSTVIRDFKTGKYVVAVMKPYSEGNGLGSMGSIGVLDIQFNDRKSAERLNQKIMAMVRNKWTNG